MLWHIVFVCQIWTKLNEIDCPEIEWHNFMEEVITQRISAMVCC